MNQATYQQKRKQLLQQIATYQGKHSTASRALSNYKRRLDETQGTITRLNKKIDECEGVLAKLGQRLESLDDTRTAVKRQITAFDNCLQGNAKTVQRVNVYAPKMMIAQGYASDLGNFLKGHDYHKTTSAIDATTQAISGKIKKLLGDEEDTKHTLKNLKAKHKDALVERQRLKGQISSAQSTVDSHASTVKQLKAQLTKLDAMPISA